MKRLHLHRVVLNSIYPKVGGKGLESAFSPPTKMGRRRENYARMKEEKLSKRHIFKRSSKKNFFFFFVSFARLNPKQKIFSPLEKVAAGFWNAQKRQG